VLKYDTLKMYWGAEVKLPASLTSKLDGVEWLGVCSGYYTTRKSPKHLSDWVGPRAGLGMMAKRKPRL
jgi:hypothetical protein